MARTYVYILSDYEEHGAEDVHATLNRSALPDILVAHWPASFGFDEEQRVLAELLQKTDEELEAMDGWNLSNKWGGVQLHVVWLEP